MIDRSVCRFDLPRLEDLPADVAERITAVAERAGFIPNVFMLLARRPAEFRAFMAYHDALMESEGGLSRAEREMIVVATSATNDCLYCVVAHGAILRVRSGNPRLADQIATAFRKAEITDRQRAMLAFAVKVARASQDIDDADLDALRAAGFTDDDIWDIASIAALFACSNRLANVADLRPNPEFYALGR